MPALHLQRLGFRRESEREVTREPRTMTVLVYELLL